MKIFEESRNFINKIFLSHNIFDLMHKKKKKWTTQKQFWEVFKKNALYNEMQSSFKVVLVLQIFDHYVCIIILRNKIYEQKAKNLNNH